MSKTFTFAGTCTENGATVYKFANKASRAKELERFGCTNVNLIELPNAMDKEAAVEFLTAKGLTAGWRRAAKIAKTAKVEKPAKAKLPKVATTAKPRGSESAAANAEHFIRAWFGSRVTPEQAEQVKSNW
jgi:inactivated superfamily I helicase